MSSVDLAKEENETLQGEKQGKKMKRFQYDITRYPSEEFANLVYSCTGDGTCSLSQVPPDQVEILEGMLNERGEQGWQLLQLIFRKDGVIAFWKREIDPDSSTA